jgi:hypothetical protein
MQTPSRSGWRSRFPPLDLPRAVDLPLAVTMLGVSPLLTRFCAMNLASSCYAVLNRQRYVTGCVVGLEISYRLTATARGAIPWPRWAYHAGDLPPEQHELASGGAEGPA